MTVARVETHADVASGASGEIGVEHVGSGEGGQFFLAQSGTQGEPDDHVVVGIRRRGQDRADLIAGQVLRQALVESRHHIAYGHLAAAGVGMSEKARTLQHPTCLVAKWQVVDPALMLREGIELAHVEQAVAHGATRQPGDLEAIVAVGSDQGLLLATVDVVLLKVVRLQEAEVVVQRPTGVRP